MLNKCNKEKYKFLSGYGDERKLQKCKLSAIILQTLVFQVITVFEISWSQCFCLLTGNGRTKMLRENKSKFFLLFIKFTEIVKEKRLNFLTTFV